MDKFGVRGFLNAVRGETFAALTPSTPVLQKFSKSSFCVENPLSGPETPKKSEKSVLDPLALGPPRVWKKSRKGLESLEKVPKRPRKDFFETFSRLSRGPGAGHSFEFSDFFGVSGPEGSKDPCKWSTGYQFGWVGGGTYKTWGVSRPLLCILLGKLPKRPNSAITVCSLLVTNR